MTALLPYLLFYCGGIVTGLLLYYLTRFVTGEFRTLDALAGWLATPFTLLTGIFRKRAALRKAASGVDPTADAGVDPREQQISDSAHTIRSILLCLADAIQKADKAASDSSSALSEAKQMIDQLTITKEVSEAHTLLMAEIDRVIDSNAALKWELASSQQILATQRSQIEELRSAVRIDGMTGIANRTYFDEKLAELIALRQRYNEPFSLLMIDVDNFKTINDAFGHPAGDRILKGVAFKVKSALRGSDFFARFGGDEFAVLLIKTTAAAAQDTARKLCATVRESRFLLDDATLNVTLSIGIAEALPGESGEALLKRADEALYRVKDQGRNNVALADSSAAMPLTDRL